MSSWLNKLERRLEPFAISNLTLYIVIAQTFVLLAGLMNAIDVNQLVLVPAYVQHGEYWRILTFIAMPPGFGILVAFALYLFYLYGNALEQYLGVVRYNLFLLVGYVLTVGLAFVSPLAPATNLFLGGAVFLAFAFLNPNFVLHLFFILPVKIKWLALITWGFYGLQFVMGGMTAKLGVLAATGNFLLFFGREILERLKTGRRQVEQRAKRERLRQEMSGPMHTCSVCQRNSDSDPELGFRYRTEGEVEVCYCEEHLPPRQA
jgi:hypothetical protein